MLMGIYLISDIKYSVVVHLGELEFKDTTESSTSAAYLDILLVIDAVCKLTT
jgi:hypothetical protein